MSGIDPATVHGQVPELLFATFQLSFAIITAALVSGAIADRAKFAAWMVFVPVWAVAGLRRRRALGVGARTAGCSSSARSTTPADWSSRSSPARRRWRWHWCSARASASRRTRCARTTCRSCCSASACCGSAGSVSTPARRWPPTARPPRSSSTPSSPGCLGMLGWLTVEQMRDGRPTTFGAASGVVAGLVAITPSCGTVNTARRARSSGWPRASSARSRSACKFRLGYDDSLDVVGRALRRRRRRCAADRTAGHRGDDRRPAGPVLRRRVRAARASSCWRVVVVAAYAFAVSYRAGQADRPGHRLPDQRRGRDVAASTSPSTPKPLMPKAFTVTPRRDGLGQFGAPGTLTQRPETSHENAAEPPPATRGDD